jgi:hypothetical protein
LGKTSGGFANWTGVPFTMISDCTEAAGGFQVSGQFAFIRVIRDEALALNGRDLDGPTRRENNNE